jgi:hypothetical protein
MAIQVDTIDIDGHERKKYSEEEKQNLKYKFIVTLHLLLIIYLSLHNLLIPLVINIARGSFLLTDVHFWFFIHLPLHYFLKKKFSLAPILFSAVGAGVIIRIIVELFLVSQFKSWGMLSIFISEIAGLIFVVAAFSVYRPLFKWQGVLVALIVIPLFSSLEVRSDWSKRPLVKEKEERVIDNSAGCQGSLVEFRTRSIQLDSLAQDVEIKDCGFSFKMAKSLGAFKVKNQRTSRVNIRLFKLHISDQVPRWRFARLYVLGPREELTLSAEDLSKERLYLLKSPEMKELGQTLIINQSRLHELPAGAFRLDSVSMQFTKESP